ncbi:MAG: hypothetical protein JO251_21900 [Verrucomicrobia bacterium]|nr:hypothetical protein [Verrucomicrobiota bacterium]
MVTALVVVMILTGATILIAVTTLTVVTISTVVTILTVVVILAAGSIPGIIRIGALTGSATGIITGVIGPTGIINTYSSTSINQSSENSSKLT